jgi:hypothetical protein
MRVDGVRASIGFCTGVVTLALSFLSSSTLPVPLACALPSTVGNMFVSFFRCCNERCMMEKETRNWVQ